MLSPLDELGIQYKTDKASVNPCIDRMYSLDFFVHDYLRHYETFLTQHRYDAFQLIEIGVFQGASLRMWKEYFPNATIIGVDINPDCVQYEEDRIQILIADGTTQECAQWIREHCDNPFLIIDDGGHTWGMQQSSLELLFPLLSPGGYYIIEDILRFSNKYDVADSSGNAQSILMYLFDRVQYLSAAARPDQKLEMLRQMPPPARYLSSHLDGAYFLNSACLLRKAHAHDEDRFIVNVGGQLFRSEYCLTEDAALADAVTLMLMSDNSKAFVVVEKNMQFLGLLTRRDIFALLKAQAPLNTVLRDICNKGPARLSSFSDEEYSHLSATTGHRIFPVVDSLGCAVGLKYSLDKDL